jgi:drug/metabolite transporter (DMT)-like permease
VLAIAEGILAATIWASSFVFIKMGLVYFAPITLAGVRYFVAFLLLLPLIVCGEKKRNPSTLSHWVCLVLMGLCAYTIGNGTLYWGLKYLAATTCSVLQIIIPLAAFFLGMFWLKEVPKWWQVVGLLVTIGGNALFFSSGFRDREPLAIGIVCLGFLAFAIFGILSRRLLVQGCLDLISLTAIPLGFGGGALLLLGIVFEGVFELSLAGGLIILWLVIVNTLIAYLLYYRSLRVLTALELHVLLNLQPLGTAIMAGALIGEQLALGKVIGIGMTIVGAVSVQWDSEQRGL